MCETDLKIEEGSEQDPLFTTDLTKPAANYVTPEGDVYPAGSGGSGTDDVYEN